MSATALEPVTLGQRSCWPILAGESPRVDRHEIGPADAPRTRRRGLGPSQRLRAVNVPYFCQPRSHSGVMKNPKRRARSDFAGHVSTEGSHPPTDPWLAPVTHPPDVER